MSPIRTWTPPGRRLALPCWVVVSLMLPLISWAEAGEAAPDLVLPVLNASPASTSSSYQRPRLLRLSAYRGKVVYLDFWDSFCAPCRESLPLLSALWRKLHPEGVEFFSVNLDVDPQRARQFLSRHPVDFQVVSDPSSASARSYGLDSLPTGLLIDRDGEIAGFHQGFRPGDVAVIEAQLRQLVNRR